MLFRHIIWQFLFWQIEETFLEATLANFGTLFGKIFFGKSQKSLGKLSWPISAHLPDILQNNWQLPKLKYAKIHKNSRILDSDQHYAATWESRRADSLQRPPDNFLAFDILEMSGSAGTPTGSASEFSESPLVRSKYVGMLVNNKRALPKQFILDCE